MKRLILLLAIMGMPLLAHGQISSHTANAVYGVTATPGACNYNVNADPVTTYQGTLYICSTGGAFVAVSGGGSSGANTALSNLSAVAINTSLLPGVNNSIDLGSASFQWRNIYFSGSLIGGSGTPSISGTPGTIPSGCAGTGLLCIWANSTGDRWYQNWNNGTSYPFLIPTDVQALPNGSTATTQSQNDNSTNIATTAYTDLAVANGIAGVNPAIAVLVATTAAGDTSALTYNNGASGIGATFTGANNTATTIDGVTFTTTGQRLLVKNDTQSPSGAFNGIYQLTALHTSITGDIFTRVLDYDTPSDMNNTGAIPVQSGTANIATSWLMTANIVTVGTTPLTFTQFSFNPAAVPASSLPLPTLTANGASVVTSAQMIGIIQNGFGASAVGGAVTQNASKLYQVQVAGNGVIASNLAYAVQAADNSANVYNIALNGPGCYGSAANVPRVAETGAFAGTVLFATTGNRVHTLDASNVYFAPGVYCVLVTSSGATPTAVLAGGASTLGAISYFAPGTAGPTTSSAAAPSTITAPSTSVSQSQGYISMELYQ